jgi:hypothetical protein
MPHLLSIIPTPLRKRMLTTGLLLCLGIMLIFAWSGHPLQTEPAPDGIVSFQTAGTLEKAQAILLSWDNNARQVAAFGLGFDYLFMPVYAITLSLACLATADTLKQVGRRYSSLSVWLARAAFLAAGLDAIENLALVIMLLTQPANPWPLVSMVCANLKFVLLFLVLIYAFYGPAVQLSIKLLKNIR